MTLWGHALFSPCTAADCLHFANQTVAMVTHPSPSPTKTPISIPPPSICLLPHTAIPSRLSLSLAHTYFPLSIWLCLVTWPEMCRNKKGMDYTAHKHLAQSFSPTGPGNISIDKKEKAACCSVQKTFPSHFTKANQINCWKHDTIHGCLVTLLLYLLPPLLCDWLTRRLHVVPLSLHAHIHSHPTHRP